MKAFSTDSTVMEFIFKVFSNTTSTGGYQIFSDHFVFTFMASISLADPKNNHAIKELNAGYIQPLHFQENEWQVACIGPSLRN